MYIIVGLGNPTKTYDKTRHNIGFALIDAIGDAYNIAVTEKKHKAIIGKGVMGGSKVILAKPQTYMNLSGESVRALVDYYKVEEESELLILYDDVSLPVGSMRIREKGSAGGHNGIKSIIGHLGHMEFMRLKIGVGEKPKGWDLADYVLGHFTKEEEETLNEEMKDLVQAVAYLANHEVDKAMNEYNKKR
ncbi:MAG: aminoacyl-tRNA hydrolase [Eubacteriales bacterium]